MDKKSIVNNLYQAVVINIFGIGYSMLSKKIRKIAPPSFQKFDLEDTGKLVAIITTSEIMREYLIKQKILSEHPIRTHQCLSAPLKTANALAFTSSSYLFLRLSKDSIDTERKRHDTMEKLQKTQIEWVHK